MTETERAAEKAIESIRCDEQEALMRCAAAVCHMRRAEEAAEAFSDTRRRYRAALELHAAAAGAGLAVISWLTYVPKWRVDEVDGGFAITRTR